MSRIVAADWRAGPSPGRTQGGRGLCGRLPRRVRRLRQRARLRHALGDLGRARPCVGDDRRANRARAPIPPSAANQEDAGLTRMRWLECRWPGACGPADHAQDASSRRDHDEQRPAPGAGLRLRARADRRLGALHRQGRVRADRVQHAGRLRDRRADARCWRGCRVGARCRCSCAMRCRCSCSCSRSARHRATWRSPTSSGCALAPQYQASLLAVDPAAGRALRRRERADVGDAAPGSPRAGQPAVAGRVHGRASAASIIGTCIVVFLYVAFLLLEQPTFEAKIDNVVDRPAAAPRGAADHRQHQRAHRLVPGAEDLLGFLLGVVSWIIMRLIRPRARRVLGDADRAAELRPLHRFVPRRAASRWCWRSCSSATSTPCCCCCWR